MILCPLHGAVSNYFRTTLAHNTLFADEKNQTGDAVLERRECACTIDNCSTSAYGRVLKVKIADDPRRFGCFRISDVLSLWGYAVLDTK